MRPISEFDPSLPMHVTRTGQKAKVIYRTLKADQPLAVILFADETKHLQREDEIHTYSADGVFNFAGRESQLDLCNPKE